MYDIINKSEVFEWYSNAWANPHRHAMKNIQDAFILSRLSDQSDKKFLEIGGGHSRILERLSGNNNECWNADKLEGAGNGPTGEKDQGNVILKKVFLGEFSEEIPENNFDVVFSISVVEHIPDEALDDVFRDIWRVLKPGGLTIHAIDVYLGDDSSNVRFNDRIDKYRASLERAGFTFEIDPVVDGHTAFKSHYASNSDLELYNWNKLVPGSMERIRGQFQNVSLKLVARK